MPRAQARCHKLEDVLPKEEPAEEESSPVAAQAPNVSLKVVKPKEKKRVNIKNLHEMIREVLDELERHRNTHIEEELQKRIETFQKRRELTETLFDDFLGEMSYVWDS